MGQASVLTDTEIRRVFRIIETTRHAERNRLAFVLSVYAGLRVGEIAALTIGDVATQSGEVRREIKLGAHQTKGSKGRTVVLSERVEKEIGSFLKTKPVPHDQTPLIASQRSARAFSNVTLSMLFKAIHEIAVILNFFTFRAANLWYASGEGHMAGRFGRVTDEPQAASAATLCRCQFQGRSL